VGAAKWGRHYHVAIGRLVPLYAVTAVGNVSRDDYDGRDSTPALACALWTIC
jgi:hypothetical protein